MAVGPGVVTHDAAATLRPVFVGAGGADPVLWGVRVEPVAVVVLLARVHRWRRRSAAGTGGLGRLGGAARALALTQALGATDGTRPVQIGAYVARPLGARFSLVWQLDTRACTGIRANEETAATPFIPGGVPLSARVQHRAALERLLSNDGRSRPWGTAHGAFDCGGPVFIRAVLTGPFYSKFRHS